jgi:hypothetical protein
MIDKNTDFPQYRKMINGKAYYKIINNRSFQEIQLIGSKMRLHQIEANQYPEMLRIMDMLATETPFVEITANEFEDLFKQIEQ